MTSPDFTPFNTITAAELFTLISNKSEEFLLLDVREPHEFAYCKIENAVLCPLSNFEDNFDSMNIEQSHKIVLYCHHGVRSARAATYLFSKGYNNLYNLIGGIDAWAKEVDSTIPLY